MAALILFLLLFAESTGRSNIRKEAAQRKINIVVIYADDLGWTDLSCYGSDLYETPAIDKLAREGVKLTDAYAACTVCSPSRAALMTGKYPARLRITDWIEGYNYPDTKLKAPGWTMYLDTAETTIAEELKKAGYTTGIVGKWHLGEKPVYWPEHHGFDVNIGGYKRGRPGSYFYPYKGKNPDLGTPPGLEKGNDHEYLTYRLTEEASHFIRRNKNDPFFLYFPHYAVHTPLQTPDSLIQYYKGKNKKGRQHRNPVYAAMIHALDQSVARILEVLEEEGLAGRTAIFFTSDNGGLVLREVTDNTPLRAGKGSAYEGGVRVPFIARIPGVTPESVTCSEPVVTMDLFPTITELAGLGKKENDGKSLMDLLKDPQSELDRPAIFWHYPHYHPGGATPYSAIRQGDWKLIHFFEDNRDELYNLKEDIGESRDLASWMADKTLELKQVLELWWRETKAQMPLKNLR
ncbi:sulfatase [Sinomicrobium sp. FJxs]|uniref:Sulfatase n=2 Tax=Sinomicrobium weinanense TaxID=2842200 RepID=A0A926JTX4_9FLAO|nr:sulfatase [Sinomicrobium weinanense]